MYSLNVGKDFREVAFSRLNSSYFNPLFPKYVAEFVNSPASTRHVIFLDVEVKTTHVAFSIAIVTLALTCVKPVPCISNIYPLEDPTLELTYLI